MSVTTTSGLSASTASSSAVEVAAGCNDLEVGLRLEQAPDTLANEVMVFRQHEAYRHGDQHMTAPPS